MSDEKAPKKSYFKVVLGGFLGLCTGAIAMYFNAIFNQVVRPAKPVANFSIGETEGLTVTFKNMASGHTGWWDFGDGSPLEPFDSEKEQLAHTYPKPGSYKASLTVRNFLMEETDRSVSVEIAGAASTPNTLPPSITGWKVETIEAKAPAVFRITGEIQNADEVVWRHGEKTEHLTAQSGPIDKFVRLDKPGEHPIVLTAMSKSKTSPQVMVGMVNVQARTEAGYEAVLTVQDTAIRVDRPTMALAFPAPIRDAKGVATRGYHRTYQASPNSKIVSISLDKSAKPSIRRDRFKVELSKDGTSAIITGEWGTSGDALAKEAGGADMIVPIVIVEERTVQLSPRTSQLSGMYNPQSGQIQIKLPPAPAAGVRRVVSIDMGEMIPNPATRSMRRETLARGALDANGTWSGKINVQGEPRTAKAVSTGGYLIVTFHK